MSFRYAFHSAIAVLSIIHYSLLKYMKEMKKEYVKPVLCVERLMDCNSMLLGSNDPYSQDQDPMKTYTGDDETIDEDDVI